MKKSTADYEMGEEYPEICRLLKTAARLGRMWGIMETLGAFGEEPEFTEEEAVENILAWSEEFLEQKEMDLVEFLDEKLRIHFKESIIHPEHGK